MTLRSYQAILVGPQDSFYFDFSVLMCNIGYYLLIEEPSVKISDFEWDEWNSQHIELGHGIEPEEAEEIFAEGPLFRKTKKGHYVALGPTLTGRYLIVVFEMKQRGVARVITGWDMDDAEKRYYLKNRRR
jgi:uncharacterized DUF497 family protein